MLHSGLSLFLVFKLIKDFGSIYSAIVTRERTFTQRDSAMLHTTDFRVAVFHWNHISSEMTCAQNTIFSCPASRGFLYDAGSGLCTPLIWLDQGPDSASALAPAGGLYLADICPKDFQAAEYGSSRTVTCVKMIRPATTYNQATSLCADSGGYLASVKTVDKLAMVVSLAQGNDFWIGMDDQVTEGVYVWQQGSDHLTNAQRTNVFEANEPNNGMGMEHCIHLRGSSGRLNDEFCWNIKIGLCERSPYEANC